MRHWTYIFLGAAFVLGGCSIKEDRSACPIYLTVRLDDFVQRGFSSGAVVLSDGRNTLEQQLKFAPHLADGLKYSCSRDKAAVAVVSGLAHNHYNSGIITIEKGQEADPIYSYSEKVVSYSEDDYTVNAVPHKQFCKLRLIISDFQDLSSYPWRFRLKAACNGLDLINCEPVPGIFETAIYPNTLNEWYAIIPRQKDNSLELELFVPEQEESLVKKLDLASVFEEAAYDWNAKDLEDIWVALDYVDGNIEVSVIPWQGDSIIEEI